MASGYITGHQHRSKATIDIKRKVSGGTETIATVLITPRSLRRFKLMQEDFILLEFSLVDAVNFAIGDYINDPIFGYFYITQEQMPRYNKATGGYDYSLRFDSHIFIFANYINTLVVVKDTSVEAIVETAQSESYYSSPVQNGQVVIATAASVDHMFERMEASWSLTDRLLVHAEQVLFNIKAIYYDLDYIVAIHPSATKAAEVKFLSYEGVTIIEALNMMATEWQCEWWVTNETVTDGSSSHIRYTIHFGKCEISNSAFVFTLGDNVESMDIARDQQTYANRIYAFGGTQNVPEGYDRKLEFTVTEESDTTSNAGWWVIDSAKPLTLDMIPDSVNGESTIIENEIATWSKQMVLGGENVNLNSATANPDQYRITGSVSPSFTIASSERNKITSVVFTVYMDGQQVVYPATTVTVPEEGIDLGSQNVVYRATININTLKTLAERGAMTVTVKATINASQVYSGGTFDVESWSLVATGTSDTIAKKFRLVYDGQEYYATLNRSHHNKYSLEAKRISEIYRFISGSTKMYARQEGFGEGEKFSLVESTINVNDLPSSYYTPVYDTGVLSKVGERRIHLPETGGSNNGKRYVEAAGINHFTKAVEVAVVFDDIFPRMALKVASVTTEQKVQDIVHEDDSVERQNWTQYKITATKADGSAFHFDTRYIMDGNRLQAVFTAPGSVQSDGFKLAGMTFEVGFNNYTQVYTIVRNEDYGVSIPNEYLYPSVGDTFFLTGWNPKAITELTIVADAETELLNTAKAYRDAIQQGQFTFTCHMMSDIFWKYAYGGRNAEGNTPKTYGLLDLGAKVTISNAALPNGSKTSRIIGYEYKLDIPYDTPTYVIGETDAYSRLKLIEKKLTKLT